MRINTRFPVAVHILALLAFDKESTTTSELIAKSVNTNPVVIRRINAMLKKANLITVKAGVGGAYLNLSPIDITLLDVYNAVKSSENDLLFDLHCNPSEKCFVGANIHEALLEPLIAAQKSLEDTLKEYTLFDVVEKIKKNL
jgi:DNA-binding IscR family transcriptional regulator